jgi:60 kDa SS-A/Ro ribonucleoprotein
MIWALERVKVAKSESEVITLVSDYNLPWEAVPTPWLGSAEVWETLVPRLPLTALLRNLGRLTSKNVLKNRDDLSKQVVNRLTDANHPRAARIHPSQCYLSW